MHIFNDLKVVGLTILVNISSKITGGYSCYSFVEGQDLGKRWDMTMKAVVNPRFNEIIFLSENKRQRADVISVSDDLDDSIYCGEATHHEFTTDSADDLHWWRHQMVKACSVKLHCGERRYVISNRITDPVDDRGRVQIQY